MAESNPPASGIRVDKLLDIAPPPSAAAQETQSCRQDVQNLTSQLRVLRSERKTVARERRFAGHVDPDAAQSIFQTWDCWEAEAGNLIWEKVIWAIDP